MRRALKSTAHALLAGALALVFSVAYVPVHGKTPASTPASTIKLAEGEELAHPVVRGSLGPWKEATVVFTRPKDEMQSLFSGRVIVRKTSGEQSSLALPPPDEPVGFALKIKSVMFRSIDRSDEKALIVLYLSHKVGSSEYANTSYVYRWAGESFMRDDSVESVLEGAKVAADVDKRLVKLKKGKK